MIPLTELNLSIVEILYLILVFAVGFIITYFAMPVVINLMKKFGHVGKDIHKNARPEVAESGGLGILAGFTAACFILMYVIPALYFEVLVFLATVLLAGGIGYIDDRVKLRSRYKMVMVIVAGGVIFAANFFGFIVIDSPTIPFLGKLRLSIVYLYVVPIIIAVFANTVNMLEGYNGEGSGTCLIAVIFLFICGLIWNSAEGVIFSIVVIAVLIPFWLFNRYPAKVFPGDVGTLAMGAMIGCIALFGSLEVAVFCALLIHIFNSFYVLYSVKGFIESSEIQDGKNDIILLEDDRIKASKEREAALTLPRLLLAKGPLTEPQLVKNFYLISIICGFFSIIATLLMSWTIGTTDTITLIIIIIGLIVPTAFMLYKFPRIRGVITLMILLLVAGVIFIVIIDLVIMPLPLGDLDLRVFVLPMNMVVSFAIVIPALLVWYFITIKYFWIKIGKMEE